MAGPAATGLLHTGELTRTVKAAWRCAMTPAASNGAAATFAKCIMLVDAVEAAAVAAAGA